MLPGQRLLDRVGRSGDSAAGYSVKFLKHYSYFYSIGIGGAAQGIEWVVLPVVCQTGATVGILAPDFW